MMKAKELQLTSEWDKVFTQSDQVNHRKATFVNRYGITLATYLYEPKGAVGKLPAIAVSEPFGTVKEQSSGLYAQMMAERGFLLSLKAKRHKCAYSDKFLYKILFENNFI